MNQPIVEKIALTKYGLDKGDELLTIKKALVRAFPKKPGSMHGLTLGSAQSCWIGPCKDSMGNFSYDKILKHRSNKEKGTGPGPEKAQQEIAGVKALFKNNLPYVKRLYEKGIRGKLSKKSEKKAAEKAG